ncbi:unnamed protein product [Phytomonas sp. EM1]|nr:unnamed protein product [Phytomonas sp. EM1]|eukprot:CCW60778.1 unnamed protein product [Phytomonas sp. isolate EM1]
MPSEKHNGTRPRNGRTRDARRAPTSAGRSTPFQPLVHFDCPVCGCRNTVHVELDARQRVALVKCTHCLSLKPRPAELPFPYATPFVPRLENKADAFFRFSEAYRKLLPSHPDREVAPSKGSLALEDRRNDGEWCCHEGELAAEAGGVHASSPSTATNASPLASANLNNSSNSSDGGAEGGGGRLGGLLDGLEGILTGYPSQRVKGAPDVESESAKEREEIVENSEKLSHNSTDNHSKSVSEGEEGEELIGDVSAFFDD